MYQIKFKHGNVSYDYNTLEELLSYWDGNNHTKIKDDEVFFCGTKVGDILYFNERREHNE